MEWLWRFWQPVSSRLRLRRPPKRGNIASVCNRRDWAFQVIAPIRPMPSAAPALLAVLPTAISTRDMLFPALTALDIAGIAYIPTTNAVGRAVT